MVTRFIFRGVALTVGVARTAAASPYDSDELAQIEDIEQLSLSELLERPVVAASRYAQRPGSSPLLVSSVDDEQIRRLGYRTLGDALRSMRGTYLSNDRNYTFVGIEGFNVHSDFNSRIALSVDDHQLNDAVLGQATAGLEAGIPMIAIERVELVRSGALSVYGRNALLGAVQVVTARGATRPGLRVEGTASANAETYDDGSGRPAVAPRDQSIAASYGWAGHGLDVFAAGEYHVDLGLSALAAPDVVNDPEAICTDAAHRRVPCDGILTGGDTEEAGSAFVALRGKELSISALASRRRKEVSTGSFETLLDETIETFDDRAMLDVGYHRSRKRSDLEAALALDYYRYHGYFPYVDDPADLPDGRYLNFDDFRSLRIGGELRGRYLWPRLGRHVTDGELAIGTSASIASGVLHNGNKYGDGSSELLDQFDGTTRALALAVHSGARAFEHLVGFAAARIDYYPDEFGASFSPQGGLVLDGGERGRLRATVGRGLRSPNIFERYFSTAQRPERSTTGTLSIERYLGQHVRVIGLGYLQRITDLIRINEPDEVRPDPSTSRGVGLELDALWGDTKLRGNYSLQRATDENGDVRLNSPRSTANLVLLTPLSPRVLLAFESAYIGARRAKGGGLSEPLFTSSAALTITNVFDQADLTLGIRNVFDARSTEPPNESETRLQIPTDARTLWLRLAIDLGRTPGGRP